MKSNIYGVLTFLLAASAIFSSCEVVGGIFKAGMWTSVIIIVVVVLVIIWIIGRARR